MIRPRRGAVQRGCGRFGAGGLCYAPAVEKEISLVVAGIPIVGKSRAGHESYYRLPTLRSVLEIGRCPDSLVPVPNVFVTHAHLDHAAGIATYASQRTLHEMESGNVYLPAEIVDDFSRIVELHRELEGVDRYQAVLTGLAPGDRVRLRGDLHVRVFPARHRVPSVGYTFLESKRKLRKEFQGLPGDRLAALRARGVEIADVVETPLLSYPGDSSPEIFDAAPEILRSRVLILECTFLRPGDEERAHRFSHLHLRDIADRASLFENEVLVLTHFSARHSGEEIRALLQAGLPPALRERTVAFV